MSASCLYRGEVTHSRLKPRRHRLRYRVFWLMLDLDEIDGLARRLKLFSRNRFNLLAFHDRDHGDGSDVPLRVQVDRHLAAAGVEIGDGGAVRLLTMPRMLGHVFNPISVYYCYRPDGGLAALIYEVHNTFGDRHSYVIPVTAAQRRDGGIVEQGCAKALYVSPFIDMDIRYGFRIAPPSETIALTVHARAPEGLVLAAAMRGRRAALDDRAIAGAVLTHPLLTLKVVLGIHWEALRLWLKGTGLTRRPAQRPTVATIVKG